MTTARVPPGPRHLATLTKMWTTKTNTVFIVAKTSGMAVPVARLSIGLDFGTELAIRDPHLLAGKQGVAIAFGEM